MKKLLFNTICLFVFSFLNILSINSYAQTTKELNQFIPMDIVDERGKFLKSVMGIGASVNADIKIPVRFVDGCSDSEFGSLSIYFTWYNANDETGKFMLQMIKDLNTVEQDKKSYFNQSGFDLGKSKIENFSGGTFRFITDTKACVNEITGPTGKMEFSTHSKYFKFSGTTIMKIELNSKIKLETVKKIISKIVEQDNKFDFSIYKTTVANEKEKL